LFPLVTMYRCSALVDVVHAPSSVKRLDDGDVLALILGW
jgi:hypothetical protein